MSTVIEVTAKLNLEKILQKRGRSLMSVTKAMGKSYGHILKQLAGERESIDYDLIAKLCVELNCTPNDFIVLETSDEKEGTKKKQK